MTKTFQIAVLIALIPLLGFISCGDKDNNSSGGISINSINGLVEKGPFVAGSSVSVYELDENLKSTGRIFEAKTNDEGAFSLNTSTSLVSRFVKLSVNGFYFNEYTGELSDAPIVLEALSSIDSKDNVKINVNILTHLEMPRVMKLVSEGEKFEDAKQQAQEELLRAFLITDQAVIPEDASITANNTSADILIAISSILLNERSDAQFTEFMSALRSDLATDGEINSANKEKIAESSLGLGYTKIKENIKNRYKELGKDVEVGDFELFIDGDGDGAIGDSYDENLQSAEVSPENIFNSEETVQQAYTSVMQSTYDFIQYQYLFDALYTNTIEADKIKGYYYLMEVYNHGQNPNSSIVSNLWNIAYRNINKYNMLIKYSKESKHDWFKKYEYFLRVYRAYEYLNMANLWGDVALVTEPVDVNNPYYSRTSVDKVFDFVISELEEAYKFLPEENNQLFCSKYLAKAIQAKAYLQKKDYNKALEAANIVINSGRYILVDNVNTIYAGNSKENIFELPKSDNTSLSPSLSNLIKKGDYLSVCRYAEILLIASEANLRLANANQAITYLNKVRTRNNRATIVNASELEGALLNEWREDLKNEGEYFYALKRFNKAQEVLNIVDYKLLLPIPRQELDANPMMKQNPGY